MVAVVIVAGCTGRGGGYIPPAPLFSEMASFGFTVSCERSSASVNLNPPAARLRIELSYTDHGSNPLGGPFTIHGEADAIDPAAQAAICIDEAPPPPGNELLFMGRFWPTSPRPPGLLAQCAAKHTGRDFCRFEVVVRDNDDDNAPSTGDHFGIKLSSVTIPSLEELPPESIIYARAGLLAGGNLEVD